MAIREAITKIYAKTIELCAVGVVLIVYKYCAIDIEDEQKLGRAS
jgi:hypothetical protein